MRSPLSLTQEEGRSFSATLRMRCYSILTTEPATRCPLYHLIKEFTGKVFANHSLSPATRRGAILSLWVAGH